MCQGLDGVGDDDDDDDESNHFPNYVEVMNSQLSCCSASLTVENALE